MAPELVWLGQRASDSRLIDASSGAPHLTLQSDRSVESPGFSLEAETGSRLRWTSQTLDASEFATFVHRHRALLQDRTILPYRSPSPELRMALDDAIILSASRASFELADSKIHLFPKLREQLAIEYKVEVVASRQALERLLELSSPRTLVVKTAHTCSGEGVWLCVSGQRHELPESSFPVLVCEYLSGRTINAHLVVRGDTVVLLSVSEQMDGYSSPKARAVGYGGNTIRPESPRTVALLRSLMPMFGKVLHSTGFVGVLGIDVIVESDRLSIVDVNPRLQGSSLLADRRSGIRLVDRHVACFLGGSADVGDNLEPDLGRRSLGSCFNVLVARDGVHRWSEVYDRLTSLGNVSAVHDVPIDDIAAVRGAVACRVEVSEKVRTETAITELREACHTIVRSLWERASGPAH